MKETELIDLLVDYDILTVTDENGYELTNIFKHTSKQIKEQDILDEKIVESFDSHSIRGKAGALQDMLDTSTIPKRDQLQILLALLEFESPAPPTDGVPKPFTPVNGELLELYAKVFDRAIVYIWRDDCPPCDVMREEFDDLSLDIPETVGLFAVYGPDSASSLEQGWDVVGAPTTLFLRHGNVASRLVGDHYASVIESETNALMN